MSEHYKLTDEQKLIREMWFALRNVVEYGITPSDVMRLTGQAIAAGAVDEREAADMKLAQHAGRIAELEAMVKSNVARCHHCDSQVPLVCLGCYDRTMEAVGEADE